ELVEVVVGTHTEPGLVEVARGWIAGLGKTAITVKDSPGFASSRLGIALALEAMRMVEEGVAEPADIDRAMTLGYRHPVGPLKTTDIVGLDVRLRIAEHLEAELGPRFAPPQILRDKVETGEIGRKSGQGFYTWCDPARSCPGGSRTGMTSSKGSPMTEIQLRNRGQIADIVLDVPESSSA